MKICQPLVAVLVLFCFYTVGVAEKQSYIVYLGRQHDNLDYHGVVDQHHELLASVLGSKEAAKSAIFYSYTRALNGFAAHIEEEHALSLADRPEVLSLFLNEGRKLHTTFSWKFMGLEQGAAETGISTISNSALWKKTNFGRDVIIANLDTGVWPESASFDDRGFAPIPNRWKGICENGTMFGPAQCNRKLIGGRYFIKGYEAANGRLNVTTKGRYLSTRDGDGHGTHTLSTAGGNFVKNASLFGFAEGMAKGGAPNARVAAYKVCWPPNAQGSECYDADILAAFDAGIYDGVDVFSVSVGSSLPLADYFKDGISIGSFHAVQKGKVVVCSAGNDGPKPGTVSNVAPWILTVAASSIDREFPSRVALGNGKSFNGQSASQFKLLTKRMYPLVSSIDAKASTANATAGKLCFLGALDPSKVKGKIVACLRGINARVQKGEAVREAGGVGMILCNAPENANEVVADSHVLPASQLKASDGAEVFKYIKSTRSPVAYIYPAETQVNTKPAPVMAAFSSQGPSSITPDILKPDITAPGLNILAAFSRAAAPTGLPFDKRHVDFNIVSGTSMSCPHVSGIVALLRGAHPRWSPAAIKSAIMTTAARIDNIGEPIMNASIHKAGPFNYGSGHVDPNKAVNPGLVYDLSYKDYLKFFCSLKYNSSEIKAITGREYNCPSKRPSVHNLNYPSITVSKLKGSLVIKRTVTNVAKGRFVYKAKVQLPPGVSVSIEPKTLSFSKMWEKKTFKVILKAFKRSKGKYVFGSLSWQNSKHNVVSPIVVSVVTTKKTL